MPNPNKERLARKDSSDSDEETNLPRDRTDSRPRPSLEGQVTSAQQSVSSPSEAEGAVGGEDPSSSLGSAARPSCLSPDWHPSTDSSALMSEEAYGSKKVSPKVSPLAKAYSSLKVFVKKISPKKKSPTKPLKIKPKPGMCHREVLKTMKPSQSGFQPFASYTYDAPSVKSAEVTEYTEAAERASMADINSIPADSTPTSPLKKDADHEKDSPNKIKKPDDDKEDKKEDKKDKDSNDKGNAA